MAKVISIRNISAAAPPLVGRTLFATGDAQGADPPVFYKSTDGGATWSQLTTPGALTTSDGFITGLRFGPGMFIVGENSAVVSTNGGTTLNVSIVGGVNAFPYFFGDSQGPDGSVVVTNTGRIILVGTYYYNPFPDTSNWHGWAGHSDDNGATWTNVLFPDHNAELASIAFNPATHTLVCTAYGGGGPSIPGKFWRSIDNGNTWTDVSPAGGIITPFLSSCQRIEFADGYFLAYGTWTNTGNAQMLKSIDDGLTWSISDVPSPLDNAEFIYSPQYIFDA